MIGGGQEETPHLAISKIAKNQWQVRFDDFEMQGRGCKVTFSQQDESAYEGEDCCHYGRHFRNW